MPVLTSAGGCWVIWVPDVGGNTRTHGVIGAPALAVGGTSQAGRVAMEMLERSLRACCTETKRNYTKSSKLPMSTCYYMKDARSA